MGKSHKEFVPGQGYSLEDWNDVGDNPELTAEDFAKARPFAEVFPDLAASIAKYGVRVVGSKGHIAVNIAADIVEKYKSEGPGWEDRIDADLRKLTKIK